MRIDLVVADAFGPFRRKELALAPGMNVVHGPNEAGKSSWYAALHSGLTGRRRAPGRGTGDQRRFKDRHKPWNDRAWAVSVAVTLDDGRRLRFSRNLNTGETVVTDAVSGARVDVQDLEHEGSVDGSRLFGLNRDSAQATVFVAQANVLRVLQDANELQELLQRAAATTTVDTTVEQALAWIEEERRLRVGLAHIGQRPLRTAQQELTAARKAADEARDAYDGLQQLLAGRRRAEVELARHEQDLQRLSTAAKWLEVERLRQRVNKARDLHTHVVRVQGDAPADASSVRSAMEVLARFRGRGSEPVPPDGSTPDELRAQISQLPAPPEGDTAPDPEVTAAHERLRAREAELTAHLRMPPPPEQAAEVDASAEELRALAASLDADAAADPDLAARVDEMRNAASAAQATYTQLAQEHAARGKAVKAAREMYDAAVAQYEQEEAGYEQHVEDYRRQLEEAVLHALAGTLPEATRARVLAVVLVLLGIRGRDLSQAPAEPVPTAPIADPPPPPVRPEPPVITEAGEPPRAPTPDPALLHAEAALALQEQTHAARTQARDQARARVAELGLVSDPAELRRVAVLLEGQAARAEAAAARAAREVALRDERDAATGRLLELLQTRVAAADDTEPVALYAAYVEQCAQRAEQARSAARRADLEEALRLREQADERHLAASGQHDAAVQRIIEVWTRLAAAPERAAGAGPDEAALALQAWIEEQERLREQQVESQQLNAALEQVLDGVSLAELESRLVAAEHEAGPRPDMPLDEIEHRLQEVQRHRDQAAAAVHDLRGRAASQRELLPSVAAAIEREEHAARRLADIQRLGALLELTTGALAAAKDKVNANLAPVLTAHIRPWLPRVTGSRYSDLRVDPDSLMVRVREPGGDYREATVLSHGTMEQVYLLLRLALADLLSTNKESAPLVLDDVTVQSDRQRTEALLDLLHEVSAQRQVVLFSQEDEVLAWAQQAFTKDADRLVTLTPA